MHRASRRQKSQDAYLKRGESNLRLVGLLDSPYTRRTAIALQFMEIEFEHIPLSVFQQYVDFAQFNPVVRAPSLVCGDGTVLMDSTLIIQYASAISPNSWSALPNNSRQRAGILRLEGLALALAEKTTQYALEGMHRPPNKQFAPWRQRAAIQFAEALALLEDELRKQSSGLSSIRPNFAEVTAVVAWTFCKHLTPELVADERVPALEALTNAAETLEPFMLAPHSTLPYPARSMTCDADANVE